VFNHQAISGWGRALALGSATCGLFCAGIQVAEADPFTVQEWGLTSGLFNYATSEHASETFTLVQNPFHSSHAVSLGSSASAASYDFTWADQYGYFLVQSTQQAEGVPTSQLTTWSSGGIYVTPSENLTLSIDASWTFDLPAWYMDTTLGVRVRGATSHLVLFSETTGGQTSYPGGLAGTVTIRPDPIILPAGETWVLSYGMGIYNDSHVATCIATGNGYVNFQITPEPTTAGLFVFGAPLLAGRRRCSNRPPKSHRIRR